MTLRRMRVLVCRGPTCGDQRGSARIERKFAERIAARPPAPNLEITLAVQSCFGHCRRGPNVMVCEVRPGVNRCEPGGLLPPGGPGCVLYHGITPSDVERILVEHVEGDRVLEELRRRGG